MNHVQQTGNYSGPAMAQGSAVTAMTPATMPPISVQMERCEAMCNDIHSAIGELDARISSVVISLPPSAESTKSPQEVPCCELHARLVSVNDLLENATRRLHELRGRVRL